MIRSILLPLAIALIAGRATAQDTGLATLDVRTSSVCDMCEKTIEEGLLYEKGVKQADLDLATNVVHVTYDAKKTSPERIRVAITKLGYYADDQPGDEKAFRNLPACCQKEGCGKPVEKKH
ncbi:MAG: heavy-metal-associated domain-containing protein [Flavobacteriales bacterium]|jgi:copper chaperone CopZ|nr:heavy-metal-associated domain-containing protein [Flavobacteriales bacterium]